MKKLLLVMLMLTVFVPAAQSSPQILAQPVSACQAQAPYGIPHAVRAGVALCHHAYITYVDPTAKIPEWVVYTLLPEHALGCLARTDAFAADQSLPNQSATPQDYVGTGFDKGHVAPDGDMSFDNQAETESFLMTNMVPQQPALNRGIWKLLETSVRAWSFQLNNPFTIYAGPIYSETDSKIGTGVIVPHGFYKIVIDDTTGAYAAWAFPQTPGQGNLGNNLTKFRSSVVSIEQITGIVFPLPAKSSELQPGQEWPADFGKLTLSKKQKCSR